MSADASKVTPTNIRWMVVGMMTGFTFLGHFNRVSISVAGTSQFIGPDRLSAEQMGLVYSAFLLTYTCAMLPGGWVIDRIGSRMSMALMGLGMGSCVILTGALGWTGMAIASIWVPLLIIRSVAGVLSVPLHPGAAHTVSQWLPVNNRATANGLITAGALAGIAATHPGFGWLMDHLGWPNAFVGCGTIMMIFSLIWLSVSTEKLSQHPWANQAEKRLVPKLVMGENRSRITWSKLTKLFFHRNMVLLTLSYAAVGYFQYLFFYWIGFYFEKQLNLPAPESRRAAFIVTISMAIGMGVGGYCTDLISYRIGRRWSYRLIAMFSMGLCAYLGWRGVLAKDPADVTVLFSLALGLLGLCEGIFWTTAPLLEKENPGIACAFLNTIGNGVGLLAPALTPVIGKHFGWTTAIAIASIICALGAVLWFWIDTDSEVEGPDFSESPIMVPAETL